MGIRKDQLARMEHRKAALIASWPAGIPFGCCWCGCGNKTDIATVNRAERGYFAGLPFKYLPQHSPNSKIRHAQLRGKRKQPSALLYADGSPKYEVDAQTGCWNWKGGLNPGGYGVASRGHKLIGAHRIAFMEQRGSIPNGMDLDHLCRNRRCCNPAHLEIVSRAENARRGLKTKLKLCQVEEIRSRYAAGGVTQAALGKEYGVGGDVISEIISRKIWK